MSKKSDKKTIIILLIVLAISIMAGGIWTYNNIKSSEISPALDNFSNLGINDIKIIKEASLLNVIDFLDAKNYPGTIWDDFYTDAQFNKLRDINTTIDIDKYINNPNPFVIPSSTEDGLEDKL